MRLKRDCLLLGAGTRQTGSSERFKARRRVAVRLTRRDVRGWPARHNCSMSGAIILTGAPGSGKSSVLAALSTLLEIEGVAFGAIESEQLARGWPWPPTWFKVDDL